MTAIEHSNDIKKQTRLWMLLGWYDILARYRSTMLGVFWIVIVNGLTIFAIGFVYSALFGLDLQDYFPYLACGYIIWIHINNSLLEVSGGLVAYRFILHSHPVKPLLVLLRVYVRNVIVLLHNVPILIGVLVFFSVNPFPAMFLVLPGFLLLSIVLLFGCGVLAFLCARFKDIQMIITAAVGVLFLITPIVWSPDILTERAYIAYLNPLTHLLDIIRKPLLGEVPTMENYVVSIGLALISALVFVVTYRSFEKKYVFWL